MNEYVFYDDVIANFHLTDDQIARLQEFSDRAAKSGKVAFITTRLPSDLVSDNIPPIGEGKSLQDQEVE